MTKHSAPQRVSRRGLAATGALSLTVAGGAFALAGASTASASSATVKYSCTLTNFGGKPYADPWTVDMNIDVPSTVAPGASIPSPKITAAVTTGEDAADQLRSFNVKSISGTGIANYTVGGQNRTVDLNIPKSDVPATGVLTTNASGTGQSETAPSTPGTIPVKVGDFTSSLTFDSGFVANIACTPVNGANTTVANITVIASTPTSPTTTPTTPTTTTDPTKPTTTTTSSSSSTQTPTSSSSTSKSSAPVVVHPTTPSSPSAASTAQPSAPAAPSAVAGPKVQTDAMSKKHGLNVMGAGFAVAGVMALGGAAVMGRRRNNA